VGARPHLNPLPQTQWEGREHRHDDQGDEQRLVDHRPLGAFGQAGHRLLEPATSLDDADRWTIDRLVRGGVTTIEGGGATCFVGEAGGWRRAARGGLTQTRCSGERAIFPWDRDRVLPVGAGNSRGSRVEGVVVDAGGKVASLFPQFVPFDDLTGVTSFAAEDRGEC